MKINYPFATVEVFSCDNRDESNRPSELKCIKTVQAWNDIIIELVGKRMEACKNQLLTNLSRIKYADEYIIEYQTESGRNRHYSNMAMQDMEFVVKDFNANNIWHRAGSLLQILKALYWADEKTRQLVIADASFDDLYSMILEKVLCGK